MRFEGVLKTWNDERGFGFIQPTNGGQELFVHIKCFPAGYGRPALNLNVTFEVEQTAEGKKRAKNTRAKTLAFSHRAADLPFAFATVPMGRTSRTFFARFLPSAVCSTSNVIFKFSAGLP